LILSELPEGSDQHIDYTRAIEIVNQFTWEKVFLVGLTWNKFVSSYSFSHEIFPSTQNLLQSLNEYLWNNQTILVKGARTFGFESVIQRLQARNHITCLEINLNAIRNNLNFFRDKLNPGVKTMVMVKAFGYGSGSVEIAEWLAFNRVDYLGVAYVDEGVTLREGGISLPIMVMNPEEFSVRALIQYNLEPEIYSVRVLTQMLQQKDTLGLKQVVRIHIKVDTGMRRLGFDMQTLDEALQILKQRQDIEVVSIMSHLASAEDERLDSYTNMQLNLFDTMVQKTQSIFPQVWSHISNTGGIVRWPQAQYDMVRLGIGLYGYSPVESEQEHLQNVHRWTTHISQIREIESHDFVGYGCSFEATQKMRIATLPVGYADGLKRILSNGKGAVEISGQLAPIVGRVCMDMTMVDVTNISCAEGDEAILLGGKITLKKMAEECSTIPYEVLTSISNRVKRKFIKE
jgi:alanine racemase